MPLSAQDALVYVMVVTAAADRSFSEVELARISSLVDRLPIFEDYDLSRLNGVAETCIQLTKAADDLENIIDMILEGLPARLEDTAYALAVELAAVDLKVNQEELRWLEMLRDRLSLDRLVTAAIERAAKARHRRA